MADNVAITAGSGTNIATDDVSGAHYQIVKLARPVADSAAYASKQYPLPVGMCELADILVEHREERRQTIAEGRNCGASRATGEVLVFINADTIPKSMDALCEAVTHWSKHSRAVAAATPVKIAPEERIWSDVIFHFCMNIYVQALNVLGIGMGRGECQIIRRKIFEELGGYNSTIVAGEDFDLYTRLRRHGTISWLRKAVIYESPRRFRKYGYWAIVWRWFSNSIAVLVFKQSVASEWELIRE